MRAREIKFRAWDAHPNGQRMMYPAELQEMDSDGLLPYWDVLSGNFPYITVMQYTGHTGGFKFIYSNPELLKQ